MAEVKNSAALDKIILYAKNIGEKKDAAFTAERFLVAVCDYVDSGFDCGNTANGDTANDDKANGDTAVRKNLSSVLAEFGCETEKLRTSLLSYINGNSSTYIDSVYIQRKTHEAKIQAAKEKISELTPELLLRCVLKEPTGAIVSGFSGESGSALSGGTLSGRVQFGSSAQRELEKKFEEVVRSISDSDETEEDTERDNTERDDASQEDEEQEKLDPRKRVALLTEKANGMREKLLSQVYGQDNAINVFVAGYFQSELLHLTDKKRTRPRATFLFAGPPGVGKTFLAEKVAEALGLPFMRFDLSEYADHEANIEFCGSDKVYRGSKKGNVTGFVEKHPKCVLLFDEVEKAHTCVINLFLQMLDAGRLRDSKTDEEVSFTDAVIIFTTNAGRQLYNQAESGDLSALSRKVVLSALRKDINPMTEAPFFPAPLCSRFASGNVVMFNHIGAHDLHRIAKCEMQRHAANLKSEVGIDVEIDELVYTALLFSEGGEADARTISGRSEAFFDNELFELFRLAASGQSPKKIEGIEKIGISVLLPRADRRIRTLFVPEEALDLLVFSSESTASFCKNSSKKCNILQAGDIDSASKFLRDKDVKAFLIDIGYGKKESAGQYLNTEDIESLSRDFFRLVREKYSDIPVYFIQAPGFELDPEEKVSFMKRGVRGIIDLKGGAEQTGEKLGNICDDIHHQNSMAFLAKANKVISFETAQTLSKDGKTAEISLFDFRMSTAVEAEDSENILSNLSKPNVRFDEVIGAEDAKKELMYFVEYLKNPKKYLSTGVRAPKGVILYGPPGTGKTMLAKAMACESDVTFITAEGNQFLQKYVGEGKDKLHELFRAARKYAPSILFVDEIDSIAGERRGGEHAAAGGEDVLTAFLAEMDGFKNYPTKPVFVLAATNFDVRPGREKSLDQALMRRFDRRVYIDLPNKEERIKFLNLRFSANSAFEISESEVKSIAVRSTGMSLASLESVLELALRTAIRSGDFKVTDSVFEEAFETFNSGEEKKWDASLLERVARHEAGHSFVSWKSGETPSYVTVVARGEHGGYMQHDDSEGKNLYTKDELLTKIRISLGGRAAEIVYYGEKDGLSTGAGGDLESATDTARQIICNYGMDEGFGLAVVDRQTARSGEMSSAVRTAVNAILAEEMQKAVCLVVGGKPAIDALVEQLLSKNHLNGAEIDRIFRSAYTENKSAVSS